MSKQILLLGEFSTGKSAFINMLLGVSLLPERLESTDIPVIKIFADKPSGLFAKESNQKYPKPLDTFSDIGMDWSVFEHAEIKLADHPLLNNGLIVWDTPGINSVNPRHNAHLENFLKFKKHSISNIYFFLHGNLTQTSLNFLKKHQYLLKKLKIIVNIKEIRPHQECEQIAAEVKSKTKKYLGEIPVHLLCIGDINDDFNAKAILESEKSNDWESIRDWKKRHVSLAELRHQHKSKIVGDHLFDEIMEISKSKADDYSDEISKIEKILDGSLDYEIDINILYELAEQNILGAQVLLGKELLDENKEEGFSWFEKAAKAGHKHGQFQLAICYSDGKGTVKNDELATHWFLKAAEQGGAISQCEMGRRLQYGIGIAQSEADAIRWYNLSAEQGFSYAMSQLGSCYYFGIGIEADLPKAVKYFQQAATLGETDAKYYLGTCYLNGEGIGKDLALGINWLREAALKGDANAQLDLGDCYFNGVGLNEDEKESATWYRKAAEQGNATAQNILGYFYEEGIGINENISEAFSWYSKSAEQGYSPAQENLALCYLHGKGIENNDVEAVKWLNLAADQGEIDSQRILGVCHENGTGTKKDERQALKWYKSAAEQEDTYSMWRIGVLYTEGTSVVNDEFEAVKWFRRASDLGDSNAQLSLGLCYFVGTGVNKNITEALKFLRLSAEQENEVAQGYLGYALLFEEEVKRDFSGGLKWLNKAAEKDNSVAQLNLGYCYENGIGVIQNYSIAVEWYRKAAELGLEEAKQSLANCYEKGMGVEKNLVKSKEILSTDYEFNQLPFELKNDVDGAFQNSYKEFESWSAIAKENISKHMFCTSDFDFTKFRGADSILADKFENHFYISKEIVNQLNKNSSEFKLLQEYYVYKKNQLLEFLEREQQKLRGLWDASCLERGKEIVDSLIQNTSSNKNIFFTIDKVVEGALNDCIDREKNKAVLRVSSLSFNKSISLGKYIDCKNSISTVVENLKNLNNRILSEFDNIIVNSFDLKNFYSDFGKYLGSEVTDCIQVTENYTRPYILTMPNLNIHYGFSSIIILLTVAFQLGAFFVVLSIVVTLGTIFYHVFSRSTLKKDARYFVDLYIESLETRLEKSISDFYKVDVPNYLYKVSHSLTSNKNILMQAENLTNNEHNQRVKGDSNSGCFVLTAVYGSPYFPIVMEFRRFRDDYLLTNILGRVSIKYYYRFGPYWAGKVQKHPVSKIFLAPFFKFVSLFLPKSKDNFRNNIY